MRKSKLEERQKYETKEDFIKAIADEGEILVTRAEVLFWDIPGALTIFGGALPLLDRHKYWGMSKAELTAHVVIGTAIGAAHIAAMHYIKWAHNSAWTVEKPHDQAEPKRSSVGRPQKKAIRTLGFR